jgi:hypothetical protein
MSGSMTVKGRTVDTNTNVFQLLGQSQSLIPFMGYSEGAIRIASRSSST